MRFSFRFSKIFFAGFVCLALSASQIQADQVNTVVPKTGVFEIKGSAAESVYVFVPEEYNPARTYPLIISLANEKEKPEDHVKSWASMAEKSGVIVMSPTLSMRSSSIVTSYDQWILDLSNQLGHQYRVAKNKIFLVGKDERANYAAYLGTKYPDKFSAVALLNGAWNGPYEKMMTFQKVHRKQVPFYVALQGAEPFFKTQIEHKAAQLQKKGYMVNLEELKSGEDFKSKEFQKKLYDWLNEKSDVWQDLVQTSKKSWKERFKTAVEENIKID